jgi:hypothetical protein
MVEAIGNNRHKFTIGEVFILLFGGVLDLREERK